MSEETHGGDGLEEHGIEEHGLEEHGIEEHGIEEHRRARQGRARRARRVDNESAAAPAGRCREHTGSERSRPTSRSR